jgi:hypothetical protein
MSWLLSNPDRPYLDHSKTDVMKTWRKFGFVPPSENKALDGLNDASLSLPMANTSEANREAKNGLKIDSNEREAV